MCRCAIKFFCAWLLGFVTICQAQTIKTRVGQTSYDVLAVGDIMLGRMVQKEMQQHATHPWQKVLGLWPQASLQLGNFEAAIERPGDACVKPSDLCLHAEPESLLALKQAGFTHVSLANNHAADLGVANKRYTQQQFIQQGIGVLNADDGIQFENLDGLHIALIAISLVPDATGHVQHIPSLRLAQQLHLARTLADKVIVSIHWGNELQNWASQQQRDAASWLIAQGVDVIFGHHPHVIQDAECIEGKPVWFSLGNHVFDQKYPSTHTGAMAACRFSRDSEEISCDGFLTQRSHSSAILEKVERNAHQPALTCSAISTHMRSKDFFAKTGTQSGLINLYIGKHLALAQNLPLRKIERIKLAHYDDAWLMLLELPSPFDGRSGLRPHVYARQQQQLIPLWRGSALAYPIRDIQLAQDQQNKDYICVLHDAVSHLGQVVIADKNLLVLAYRWSGFGFQHDPAPALMTQCNQIYQQYLTNGIGE